MSDTKKITIILITLFILLAVIYIIRSRKGTEFSGEQNMGKNGSSEEISTAIRKEKPPGFFVLVPDKPQLKIGEAGVLTVKMDTKGKIAQGADVILKYDPLLLKALNIKSNGFFILLPRQEIDNERGMVKITAFSPSDGIDFQKENDIFSVEFEALTAGAGKVVFDWEPDETNRSNIVEKGTVENILGSVVGADLVIVE